MRVHLADEAVAAAMCRFDEARRLRIVRERPAELADGDLEDAVADEDVAPDRADQAVLRHEPPAVLDQMPQHREGLRRELDGLFALPEALVHEVQVEGREMDAALIAHVNYHT